MPFDITPGSLPLLDQDEIVFGGDAVGAVIAAREVGVGGSLDASWASTSLFATHAYALSVLVACSEESS